MIENVFDYAKKNLWETDEEYPYKAVLKDCHHKKDKGIKVLAGYKTAHGVN